jgi:hypothetical protein
MTTITPTPSVQSLNSLVQKLNALNGIEGLSFRKIASLPEFSGIPFGTLANIAKGREPKDMHTRVLLRLEKLRKPSPPAWVTQSADFLAMKRKQKLEEIQ